MKKLLTSLLAAVTLGTAMIAAVGTADAQPMPPRWHHRHHGGGIGPGGAAALGVLGGLAIGSALSQQSYDRGYYYEDEPVVVRRRPVRVYDDEYVVVKRRAGPRCQTIIKYDMYGKPYEWKDCN